jgi:hypothetical protein
VRPILPANHFCDKFPQAESYRPPQNPPRSRQELRPIFRANHFAAHSSNQILQPGLIIRQRLCSFCGLRHSDLPTGEMRIGLAHWPAPFPNKINSAIVESRRFKRYFVYNNPLPPQSNPHSSDSFPPRVRTFFFSPCRTSSGPAFRSFHLSTCQNIKALISLISSYTYLACSHSAFGVSSHSRRQLFVICVDHLSRRGGFHWQLITVNVNTLYAFSRHAPHRNANVPRSL